MNNNELCSMLNDAFKRTDLDYIAETQDNKVVISNGSYELSTIPIPLREDMVIGNRTSECSILIQLYSDGKFYEPVTFKSNDLLSSKSLISKFGLKPFAGYGDCDWDMTFIVIQNISKLIKQNKKYLTCGWLDDNRCFLYGTNKVTKENVIPIESTLVQQPTVISDFDCKFVADLLPTISKDPFYGYMLSMHFLLSLLKERFYNTVRFCPSYALVVIGKTGTGKTSSAMLVLNPTLLQCCCFEDTQAAIRRIFQSNNNGCTVVDDFKCNSKKNNEKFEEIVRLAGDITSNGKRVSNQKADNTVVTGMAAFTGEELPHLQASSFPRLFILEIEPEMINFKALTTLTENIGQYNAFAVEFIRYIISIDNFDIEFTDKVKTYRDSWRLDQTTKGMHGRYFDTYGWLATIWDYFCEFCSQHECVIEYDFKHELQSRLIRQWGRFDTDPVKMYVRAFLLLKENNVFHITGFDGMKNGVEFEIMDKADEYFVCSGKVYQKIVGYYKNEGITFPCSEQKLRQELFKADILIKRKSNVLTDEIKTAQNKGISGYYLSKHVLKKFGGNDYDEI